jgi:hypothetical protein
MMLKPSLSFAGPREYRWQGLEVPAMMGNVVVFSYSEAGAQTVWSSLVLYENKLRLINPIEQT